MASGTVKWWNPAKGFGFVTTSEGVDAFVHTSELRLAGAPTLCDGQAVEFEIGRGMRGPIALNVRLVGEPTSDQLVSASVGTTTPYSSVSTFVGTIQLSDLADCVGAEIVGVATVEKVLDEIIRLENGDRYRVIDGSTPLAEEFDDVLVLRDRIAGVYKLVSQYEVLEAKKLRPKL
jgi:cold shock protein